MKPGLLLLCGLACFYVTGCDSPEPEKTGQAMPDASQMKKTNEAGLALLRHLSENGTKNTALSPVSIKSVFGPIQRGTASNTYAEIFNTLGDSVAFDRFTRELAEDRNELTSGDVIVVDNKLRIADSYKKTFGYNELRAVDFSRDSEEERKKINEWVKENTKGEITDLLPEGSLGENTRMVALNAITFEGRWKDPFLEENTAEGVFHAPGGDRNIPMMRRSGNYAVTMGKEDATLVSLPYSINEEESGDASPLSFLILIPDSGMDFSDFTRSLTWEKLSKLIPGDDEEELKFELILPRFRYLSPPMTLSGSLKAMGVRDVFDPERADFSNMTPDEGFYLDEVYHRCLIKVDEKGTKAAAASGATIMTLSLPPTISVDRPFLWFIYDREHKLILFCGVMTDPQA